MNKEDLEQIAKLLDERLAKQSTEITANFDTKLANLEKNLKNEIRAAQNEVLGFLDRDIVDLKKRVTKLENFTGVSNN